MGTEQTAYKKNYPNFWPLPALLKTGNVVGHWLSISSEKINRPCLKSENEMEG